MDRDGVNYDSNNRMFYYVRLVLDCVVACHIAVVSRRVYSLWVVRL